LRTRFFSIVLAIGAGLQLACTAQLRKSDAELGLNPQQASGRHVYDRYCATCHEAYSSRSLRGPSLEGIFKKQFMPSGAPANDERVREVIRLGRSKMPAFGQVFNEQQTADLLSYLHTL
jgi:mono/diheme cytochrome c family protein